MRTAIDPGEPVQYWELFASGRVRRVYLDELGETADCSVGAGMIQLIVESSETAGERARGLIQQAQQDITDEALRRKVVELIDIINGCDGIVERRDSALYKSFAIRMPPDLI